MVSGKLELVTEEKDRGGDAVRVFSSRLGSLMICTGQAESRYIGGFFVPFVLVIAISEAMGYGIFLHTLTFVRAFGRHMPFLLAYKARLRFRTGSPGVPFLLAVLAG